MPVQSQLFPDPPHTAPPPRTGPAPAQGPANTTPASFLWMQRISLFILVLFCVYLGVIVAILPWWRQVWDRNLFFQMHPALWSVLRRGAVRGLISGMGLLDIWIGISEAVHYHETTVSLPTPPPSPDHA